MTYPADLLASLVAADATAPRLTVYDDTDGPTRGERVELSARVFTNWVSKAANALEDADLGVGGRVHVDLPPHWRGAYWAFATWSVGACVMTTRATGDRGTDADIIVTTDPTRLEDAPGEAILVTLAALARSAGVAVPDGVMDEARELATYADRHDPMESPEPGDPALDDDGHVRAYADLAALAAGEPLPRGVRAHTGTADLGELLVVLLRVWAAGGSVVLTRGTPERAVLDARLRSEGVTLDLSTGAGPVG